MKKSLKNKITISVLCLALTLCTVFGACTTVSALSARGTVSQVDTDDVTVSVSIGYSSEKISVFKWIPVYVTVKNNTEKDLSGTVVIDFPASSVNYYSNDNEEISVEKAYSLAAGTEKTIEIPFYLNNYIDQLVCSVTDRGNKVLYRGSFQVNSSFGMYYMPVEDVLIGYVTDDGDSSSKSFDDLKASQLSGGNFISVAKLTPDRFPSSEAAMNSFDMIVIGNIDTSASSSYSGEQMELLHRFLESGKPVVIGTGAKKGSALKGFADYFAADTGSVCTELEAGERTDVKYITNIFTDKFGYGEVDFPGSISICSVTDPNFYLAGVYIYRHTELPLFVTGFNFSDFDKIKGDSLAYCVISDICDFSPYLNGRIFFGSDDRMSQNFLYMDTKDRSPSGVTILFFMLVYIGVAVIGTFIFLTVRKKEKYMWLTTPVFALLFTVIFLIYGVIYKGGYSVNAFSVVELGSDGRGSAEVQAAVYAAKGGWTDVSFGYEDALYYNTGDCDFFTGRGMNSAASVKYGSENKIEVRADKDSYIAAACSYTDASYGPVEALMSATGDGRFNCRITNKTGKKLSGAIVCYYGMKFYIGDIAVGESVEKVIDPADPSTSDYLFYKLCYEPAGYSDTQMRQDYLELNNVYIKGGLRRYLNENDLFGSLKKNRNQIFYSRAFFLRALDQSVSSNGTLSLNDKKGAQLICFDESSEIPVTVNGKKIRRAFSQTMLVADVRADGDLSLPLDAVTVEVQTAQSMQDFSADITGKVFFTPGTYDQSYNYFVYLIKVPHAVTTGYSELQVVLEFEDEKIAPYFAAYAPVRSSSGIQFEPVLEGANAGKAGFIIKIPASAIVNSGSDGTRYAKSYGSLTNNCLDIGAYITNSFDKKGHDWVGIYEYSSFSNYDVIPIVINCSAHDLLKAVGEGNQISAPVISGLGIDGTEIAFRNAAFGEVEDAFID